MSGTCIYKLENLYFLNAFVQNPFWDGPPESVEHRLTHEYQHVLLMWSFAVHKDFVIFFGDFIFSAIIIYCHDSYGSGKCVYMHCQLFWFKLWDPLFKVSNQYQYFGCGKVSDLISVNVGQSSLSVKFFWGGGGAL